MSESVPALIAEARKFDTAPAEYAVRLKGAHDLIDRLADALESLSASPGDDEREALANWLGQYRARVTDHPIWVADWEDFDAFEAANILRYRMTGLSIAADPNLEENTSRARQAVAALRRPSPLTQEALIKSIDAGRAEYLREDIPEDGQSESEVIANAILSRFSLPEPARRRAHGIQSGWLCEPVEEEPTEERKAKAREMGWRILRRRPGLEPGPWVSVEEEGVSDD